MADSGPQDPDENSSDLDPNDVALIRQSMEALQRPAAPTAGQRGRLPQFPDLESWVNEFFVLTFGRSGGHTAWCDHWWDHPEAVLRLGALWRTWEAAAPDPDRGMAAWIRDDLDPALTVLLSPTGPFAACGDEHVKPEVLPVAPTPPGWWAARLGWWDVLGEDDR